ncbi:MAG: alpha/beta hydrolase [Candidatus Omnitrophica bacterium]|nr:alpha/beta hydrolase [Candidatus Omnitrophota bacterium]
MAIIVLVTAVGVFFLVRYLESTAIFFPGKDVFITPSRAGLPYEDVYIQAPDGVRINAWFLKRPHAASTLIFAHGNAGTMGDRLMKIKFFHDLGLNVLAFDYRGYGKSEGVPTEKGIYLDAQAAHDYLKSRGDINMERIILYGASLGGVVAVDLAAKRPAAALIVDSSITSAREAAQVFYPHLPSFLMRVKFDSLSKIRHIPVPKLFIHSPQDQTVPYAMGRRLFEAASGPKEFITSSGGHNEVQIVSDHKTANALKLYLISKGLL